MAFRLVSPNSLQPPALECLRPDSQQVGTQPHLSAEQLPKVVLSAQPPLNIPHDTALPTTGVRASSTHQWAGTSLSQQEVCTDPGPTSPTRGQTLEARGTTHICSLRNRDYKHGKLDKMGQQRNMFQTKEQDKLPTTK